jgi:uncharacterized OsmC-like protein
MTGRTSTDVDPKLKAIMADAVAGAKNGTGALRGTYRVDVALLDNVTTEARARGFRLIVDEPPSFGGADSGPNPEEVLLAGVGTCQAITAALYAALLGIPITRYHVRIIGDADFTGFYGLADSPKGFDRVRCEVTLEADAPEEKLREFEQLVEDRCVGHGTLRNPVEIQAVWKITGSDSAGDAS